MKIYDSKFKNINTQSKGGCFEVNGKSYILMERCSFENISSLDSGAVFNSGYETVIEIKNCYCKLRNEKKKKKELIY